MKKFKQYLQKRGYHKNTITGYNNLLKQFFKWCNANRVNPDDASLEELYNYQSFCRCEGQAPATIREKILVVRHYYHSMNKEDNPALLIVSEKRERKLPNHLLDEETMMEMYFAILPGNIYQKRNKCILGLLLFQGIKRSELETMELDHLGLDKGRIYVPSTTKTNARYVVLNKCQLKELEHYKFVLRDQLIKEAGKATSRLFFSRGTGLVSGLNNALAFISRCTETGVSSFQIIDPIPGVQDYALGKAKRHSKSTVLIWNQVCFIGA